MPFIRQERCMQQRNRQKKWVHSANKKLYNGSFWKCQKREPNNKHDTKNGNNKERRGEWDKNGTPAIVNRTYTHHTAIWDRGYTISIICILISIFIFLCQSIQIACARIRLFQLLPIGEWIQSFARCAPMKMKTWNIIAYWLLICTVLGFVVMIMMMTRFLIGD